MFLFVPGTRRGMSRLEMQRQGPLHPNKTEQDYMPPSERPRVLAAEARRKAMRPKVGA